MCKSPLHPLLVALPKCEHHVHLEGTLSPELLFELAAKNNITLPSTPEYTSPTTLHTRYNAFASLDDFLSYYYIGFTVLITPSDYESLAYAYITLAASHNVRHAEIFFDPQVHLSRGVPISHILSGFEAASVKARQEYGITSLLIPCLLRHLPVPDISFLDLFNGTGMTGFGLCSTELDKPPALYADIFTAARARGLRVTAHAGEEGPASYVHEAITHLQVERVDHGIRAAEDEDVMKMLAERGTMLTVCPLSNVRLKAVRGIEEVPVRKFLDKGVRFSLNSDDPAYFGGYIMENYCAVEEAFGLGVEEWGRIVRWGVEGSWCDEGRKGEILREVEVVLRDWRQDNGE
ncbi:hypothetical protein OQA88_11287 [Cercophora sp. LCS_1]